MNTRSGIYSGLLLLALWQLLAVLSHWHRFLLPSPMDVIESLWQHRELLLNACIPTLIETLLGLILGVCCGMLFALLLALFNPLRQLCLPLLAISQALPIFALAPLIILWFGFGLNSKILVIVLMLFFPVASAFDDGLQRTPPSQQEYAQSVNCPSWRLLLQLRFAYALPGLTTGLRLAACYAPMGAIIAEWVGASQGLGALMLQANAQLDTALVFACMVVLVLMTLSIYGLMQQLCRYLLKRWPVI